MQGYARHANHAAAAQAQNVSQNESNTQQMGSHQQNVPITPPPSAQMVSP